MLEFLKVFILFKALYSACGLPLYEVDPEDIIDPSCSTTHPTDGFLPVDPKLISA